MHSVRIGDSKSIANRLLILASFDKTSLALNSDSTDVLELQLALKSESQVKSVTLGGTTFRFLIARLSRMTGEFFVDVDPHLLSRPQVPLYDALRALGVVIDVTEGRVRIESSGWKANSVEVDCSMSSQFASSMLLSSLDLDRDLTVHLLQRHHSNSYLDLTIQLMRRCGVELHDWGHCIHVPAGQCVHKLMACEADVSSCFSIAAIGAVGDGVIIENFPLDSLQPDLKFLEIFERLGVRIRRDGGQLQVLPCREIVPLELDLTNCPDLFPVLSAFCSLFGVETRFTGIENLKFKESDRLAEMTSVLTSLGAKCTTEGSSMRISGPLNQNTELVIDPKKDHRLAMAAGVLMRGGCRVSLRSPEVVNKSYANFWQDSGLSLGL